MPTSNLPSCKNPISHAYFHLPTVQREASALATHHYFKQHRKEWRPVKPSTGVNLRNIFPIHALIRRVTARNVKRRGGGVSWHREVISVSLFDRKWNNWNPLRLITPVARLPKDHSDCPLPFMCAPLKKKKKISLSFGRRAFARSDDKGSWYRTLATYPTMAFENTAFNYSELAQ